MQAGDRLEHYELRQRIGKGGFGEVFLAQDLLLEVNVAIKILLPQHASNHDLVRRFHIGAKAAAQLNHPNIIRVLYMGELSQQQIFFTVMEYLPNGTLADRVRHGAMTLEAVVPTFVKIADAVSFAHDNGFIHRDLKPVNILYNHSNEPVITDFDISRIVGEARMTQPGVAMGTIQYFSPEQAKGEDVTPQSDVYALGVILFLMLTGTLPYSSKNPSEILQMHISHRIPKITDFNHELPRSVNNVIKKAMAKKIQDRFQTATELADALMDALPRTQNVERVEVEKAEQQSHDTLKVVQVPAKLIILNGHMKGQEHHLKGWIYTVGYSREHGNDLGLGDDYVSTHHGRFELQDEGWFYIDLDSSNGTCLVLPDGSKQRLLPNRPRLLSFGDILEIGDTLLKLEPQRK